MEGTPSILEILATLSLFIAPIVTYILAKRKERGQLLLTDIEAIQNWNEVRRGLEKDIKESREEIRQLQKALDEAQEELRDSRIFSAEQNDRIVKLEELLQDCLGVTLS